jgi:N-methylhydantoinase A
VPTRIGIDIGGTFTDMIFYDDQSGAVHLAKTATTPDALERGVLQAVEEALSRELVQEAEFFLHGTTVGLNALLQRRGAATGLLCTEGFRDSLEIRRGDRALPYDLLWKAPTPFVPRRYRISVRERIRADGEVLTELVTDDIHRALEIFREADIDAIAVCLMNSYANPAHELEAERILRESGFSGDISLSHRLSREYREYERTSTTVIDAYIRGVTSRYLAGLRSGLETAGFAGDILVTRSGGGAMIAEALAERPYEAIQSGPVAGAEGAGELCRRRGWRLGIAADVGGTSFDTSLIVEGRTQIRHEGSIVGWPIQAPWVDVHSIGAGGGSIAYVDGGLLRVGPRSAGADPGPACYGRGGTEPTVTDAALMLGMLGDGQLSASLRLQPSLAEGVILPLAEDLGMSVEEVAQGVLTVTTAAMAGAMREITIGQGEDPRGAALILFGGAGPLFGTLLAAELEVGRVVIPPHAGNFSAWGLLGQDFIQEGARTVIRRFTPGIVPELNAQLDELFAELVARHGKGDGEEYDRIAGFDLRYLGQEHTLTVQLPVQGDLTPDDLPTIASLFAGDYERRFGTTLAEPLELVTIRATTRKGLPRRAAERVVGGQTTGVVRASTSRGYSFARSRWLDFAVHERAELPPDATIRGPAIIFEPTATIYIDADHVFSVDEASCLLIQEERS